MLDFYNHGLSFLCHDSMPRLHLTKVLPKYPLIAKHLSATLFMLCFRGADWAKSLMGELENNLNGQEDTFSGAISKCNSLPTVRHLNCDDASLVSSYSTKSFL